jgi:hypothetical protein
MPSILLLCFTVFISNNLLVQQNTRHIGTMLASYITGIKGKEFGRNSKIAILFESIQQTVVNAPISWKPQTYHLIN